MNRLILIGNGFDLAHNLKTSYSDFLKDYISNSINDFITKFSSVDPLLSIRQKYSGSNVRFRDMCTPEYALRYLEELQNHEYVNITIKSRFLIDTIKRLSEVNWVDLENDYFSQLIKYKVNNGFNFERVKELNTEFDFLKNKLEEYLAKHQKESDLAFSNDYQNIFCEMIRGNEIVTRSVKDQLVKRILILNFNYTNTVEKYKEACNQSAPTDINYIHGQLNTPSNPIIFGFGDEFNKDYLEFEDLRNKELLKHIKSFGYFKTSNYHNLIRFTDSDDFQVYILGHSLGLSDRTMLKQIFEHESCKSIKIFYHQLDKEKNDYTDKTFDISSHFTDKGMMRKKIIPFNLSKPMPQLDILDAV